MSRECHYWLMKSEPNAYSIDDLEKDGVTHWDGVRNYQARNFMRDEMKRGDRAFFYHSNADPSGVAGVIEVWREAYPDSTAWDRHSKYFDPKSTKEEPRWFMVDVKFVEKFPRLIPLSELKQDPALSGLMVLQKGSRLSIQPISAKHFHRICQLGR